MMRRHPAITVNSELVNLLKGVAYLILGTISITLLAGWALKRFGQPPKKMKEPSVIFTIPTYRLRDVAETIEKYDEHFWSNGHLVKMMVFDDSSLANHKKYYALLEQTKTVNDIYYVGPREKKRFISFLNRRLRDKKLDSLVRNLFRPSYGGNRNFTLMYLLAISSLVPMTTCVRTRWSRAARNR